MPRNAQNGVKMGVSRCRPNHENENWGKFMKYIVKNRRKELTQYDMVLNYLRVYGEITPLDAYKEFAILRLSAIIYDMRKDGWHIDTEYTTTKNRFGAKVTYATYIFKEV